MILVSKMSIKNLNVSNTIYKQACIVQYINYIVDLKKKNQFCKIDTLHTDSSQISKIYNMQVFLQFTLAIWA